MVTSVNLSLYRKTATSIINTISSKKNVKTVHFKRYNTVIMLTLLCILTRTEPAFAKEINTSEQVTRYYSYFTNFFQTLGFPTIDIFFQLIRIHKPLIDYIKYKTL